MPAEKRLLESRRTVRSDEIKASNPAITTAGKTPYEHATIRMNASEAVNVIVSFVNLRPNGGVNEVGNIPTTTTSGSTASVINCSRKGCQRRSTIAANVQRQRPAAVTAV